VYAIFETGGKQYRAREGETLRVERLPVEAGAEFEFDRVLLVDDGETPRVGTPYVEGGKVSAIVKGHGRGEKVRVVKFKRRTKYRRLQGHRQAYTEVVVNAIAPGRAG